MINELENVWNGGLQPNFRYNSSSFLHGLRKIIKNLRIVDVQPRLGLVASQIQTTSHTASVHLLGDKQIRTYQ
jgi:hypothetical protein